MGRSVESIVHFPSLLPLLVFYVSLPLSLLFCRRWAFFKESRNDIGVWDHLSPHLHVTLCTATLLNCVTAVFTRVPQLRRCQHNMFSSFSSVEGKLLLRKRPCLKEQRSVDERVVEAGDGNFHLNKRKYYQEMGNKLGDLFRLPLFPLHQPFLSPKTALAAQN